MSNPLFSESVLDQVSKQSADGVMTLKGTINKTLLLLVTMLVPAGIIWWKMGGDPTTATGMTGYLWGSAILGFVLALVITFKKEWAPFLAPVYAVAQGVFLGLVSMIYNYIMPGIVSQAIIITLLIFGVMLVAYRMGWVRATPRLAKILMFGIVGVGLFYLAIMLTSVFGYHGLQNFYMGSSPLSIGISCLVAGIAAFCFILDFDLIEKGSAMGAPKYMEWYASFGLMVTLIWLYLEILRLLAKLRD